MYFLIFFNKVLENMLSTVRIIVIAKNKKTLGAILNGLISLVWIFSTSMVISNINKNIFKIISFCLGAIIGSYLGSIIENRITKK